MLSTVSCDSCAHHNVCRFAEKMVVLSTEIIDRPVHTVPSVGAGMEPELFRITLDDNRKAFGVVLAQRCGYWLSKPPSPSEFHQSLQNEELGSLIRGYFEKELRSYVNTAPIGVCPPFTVKEYIRKWASFRQTDTLSMLIFDFFWGRKHE